MIKWQDQVLILRMSPFQEKYQLIVVFSKDYGIYKGLLRITKQIPLIGTFCTIQFHARLESHLGKINILQVHLITPSIIFHAHKRLILLSCMLALLVEVLAEHDPYPVLFNKTHNFCKNLLTTKKPYIEYFLWEKELLSELGFALNLNKCAVTHTKKDLCYISPRTGRAICRQIGIKYHNKLLPLPSFLIDPDSTDNLLRAYYTLGFFFNKISTKSQRVRSILEKYLNL